MMVVGRVEHSTGAEADRQAELTDRNFCLLAKSFSYEGIVPVMDFIIDSAARLTTYTGFFSDQGIHLVTLFTTIETARQRFQKREAHEAGSGLEGLATKLQSELLPHSLPRPRLSLGLCQVVRPGTLLYS